MENTFICLLPCDDDAAALHEAFDALFELHAFPYIKLPLHVTLYFFPALTAEKNPEASAWVRQAGETSKGPIVADIEKVSSFQRDGHDFVYYIPVFSKQIINLHDDLFARFKRIHTDPFDFVPHLSLFYPARNLQDEEKKKAQKLYAKFQSITFDRIAFAAEKGKGTHFIDVQPL
ncbi:2'-5' RNA ligase family protein [Patescibacteria group bacterium]|nr:2'-5' RNA ligase family protein [Patescibacteria group bacterium]